MRNLRAGGNVGGIRVVPKQLAISVTTRAKKGTEVATDFQGTGNGSTSLVFFI